ncbi:MAG TPA: hypothetical protein VE482_04130, partial [Candidatus Eisenbacteria bacterium]|nr:hypothetical protein [Candidatus Eisenbacteria bacterium]
DRLLEQLGGESAVGTFLIRLDHVAIRHDPAVGMNDGPAPELAMAPGLTTVVAPLPQRTVAVAPIRTATMTTAGFARKTAD